MKKMMLSVFMLLCLSVSFTYSQVMVVAHRGDWRNAPENSLRAVKLAADMGVDMVEVDLKMTRDCVIVIMHDETINRTTNGKGKPSDYTFEEIRKFRLKNGLGRATEHVIPTLEEIMLVAKENHIRINLDKSLDYYKEAYAICKRTGTLDLALFKTEVSYDEVHKKYGELLDSIHFMPVINLDKPNAAYNLDEYLTKMKPFAAELVFAKDTSSVLLDPGRISRTGTKIWINSLWSSLNGGHDDDKAVDNGDTKNSWDWILAHGATVIQTDRPKELLEYLKRRKLR